jgi:transposase
MPRERLSMRKVREVLRLKYEQQLSNRAIALSCRLSVGSVHDYLQRARVAGLSWPLPDGLSDEALDLRLFPPANSLPSERALPDWERVARELRRKAVTLALLWEEYRSDHPDGYGYSRYCELFQGYSGTIDPRMRQIHKAGEKLFVDYAGMTMPVIDRSTGEASDAQIFVATLGASDYTYAEGTWSQCLQDWIGSHVRAFAFLGGVPQIIVPDNLKTGITSACFYEPDINRTYFDMATHYDVAVIPARPAKPRDKALVENHVKIVEQRILAHLRDRRFFSLGELNEAIWDLLEDLNNRPFQKMSVTRAALFAELDAPALRPLPLEPYHYGEWGTARVNIDYHVAILKSYYSVPYRFLRQPVETRVSACTVEIYLKNVRIASHARSFREGSYSTVPEHMPSNHRAWQDWSPERMVKWAAQTGPSTAQMVEELLTRFVHPQQGYRRCLGIMSLARAYGADRVELACQRALACQAISYKSVKMMLKNNLDAAALPEPIPSRPSLKHDNIRGADYYAATSQLSFESERS